MIIKNNNTILSYNGIIMDYASYSFLLDVYTGSSVAYSLRKLRTAYTGNSIRIRRSNDNSETDIGFDSNNNLDTTSLLSFVGSNSAFITTWYDQSGNGKDIFQTNSINQPRIVNRGICC